MLTRTNFEVTQSIPVTYGLLYEWKGSDSRLKPPLVVAR
jgi:hypothetical protein